MAKESILHDKQILAIGAETELLKRVETEITTACPTCCLEAAATYQEAMDKIVSWTYDLILLDQMIDRSEKLLEIAQLRKLPVTLLTSRCFPMKPDLLELSLGSHSRLPRENIKEIVPFLQNLFSSSARLEWKNSPARWSDSFRSVLSFRRN
jgi:hypothetical protein